MHCPSCLLRTATSSDHGRPYEERRDVGFNRIPVQCGHHACYHRQGSWSPRVPQQHPGDRPEPCHKQPAWPHLPALLCKLHARLPGEGRAGPTARGQSPRRCCGLRSRRPKLRAGLAMCLRTQPQSSVSPEQLLREILCRFQKCGRVKEPADEAHFSRAKEALQHQDGLRHPEQFDL